MRPCLKLVAMSISRMINGIPAMAAVEGKGSNGEKDDKEDKETGRDDHS